MHFIVMKIFKRRHETETGISKNSPAELGIGAELALYLALRH
jgi:hypothetical protein